LIVYMALAAGRSRVRIGPPTMHTRTAATVAAALTGAAFRFRPCRPGPGEEADAGPDAGPGWTDFVAAAGAADGAAGGEAGGLMGGPILLECEGIGYGAGRA
jgi:hypothetical protein